MCVRCSSGIYTMEIFIYGTIYRNLCRIARYSLLLLLEVMLLLSSLLVSPLSEMILILSFLMIIPSALLLPLYRESQRIAMHACSLVRCILFGILRIMLYHYIIIIMSLSSLLLSMQLTLLVHDIIVALCRFVLTVFYGVFLLLNLLVLHSWMLECTPYILTS